jgi:hypothetical protein
MAQRELIAGLPLLAARRLQPPGAAFDWHRVSVVPHRAGTDCRSIGSLIHWIR